MQGAVTPEYLGPMRWTMIAAILCCTACTRSDGTLCERFYQPYPDLIGDRARTTTNGMLLDAMSAYRAGEFADAIPGLEEYLRRGEDITVRMYLASAYLGAGQPYKAEMHLDRLENNFNQQFKDQVEWYNALCWLCEGQNDRALKQVQWIAALPRHTYKEEARALAATLSEP